MSFVRFLFSILIAGMVVNLAIVLLANTWSHKNQTLQFNAEKQKVMDRVNTADGQIRRLDMVVESQSFGAVTNTTVLVRQYQSLINDQSDALPVQRIVIPTDRIQVEGLKLEFLSKFEAQDPELQWLHDKTLLYFAHVCGATEQAPEKPQWDERFSFVVRDRVPELNRIDPFAARPSYFETRLWNRLWQIIPDPYESPLSQAQLQVTWIKPAQRPLRLNHTYSALITSTEVILEEDRPGGIPNLLSVMLELGRKLPVDDSAR